MLDDMALAKIAEGILAMRREREHLFRGDLFADPAWDIMLALFVQAARGWTATVTNAVQASAVPPTTALQHLRNVTEAGVVTRSTVEGDGRLVLVALSDSGRETMRTLLSMQATSCQPTETVPSSTSDVVARMIMLATQSTRTRRITRSI